MRTTRTALKAMALLLLAPAMMLCSCSDVDDGSYVDPIKLTGKISGEWVLNSITQTDETTGNDLVLTSALGFDSFGIQLGESGTFTVTGNAPKLLPTSGTWELDNDFVKSTGDATQLLLKGGDGTTTLTLTSVPGATPELGFSLTRYNKGEAFVSYKYSLANANAATPESSTEE